MQEKSAGAVIFRRDEDKIFYLLLQYKQKTKYWDLPRGNIEKNEEERQTVLREVKEETGLADIKFVDGFRETTSWVYVRENQKIFKEVIYFLAETEEKEVTVSWEHEDYGWFEFNEAIDMMTYDNSKVILEKADKFLKRMEKESLAKFLKQKQK